LQDLIEVTRMDAGVEDTDDNEAAYTEILEYVRVGVMIIGLTLRPDKQPSTLH